MRTQAFSANGGSLQEAGIADDAVEIHDAAGSEADERDAERELDALENLALAVDDVIQETALRSQSRARNDPQVAIEIRAHRARTDRRVEVRNLVGRDRLEIDRQFDRTVG